MKLFQSIWSDQLQWFATTNQQCILIISDEFSWMLDILLNPSGKKGLKVYPYLNTCALCIYSKLANTMAN